MPSFREQLKFAKSALEYSKSLENHPGTSYLKAIRTSATEVIGQNIGRAVPIKSESKLKHVTTQAERKNRPYIIADSDVSGDTFVLLIDTSPIKPNVK